MSGSYELVLNDGDEVIWCATVLAASQVYAETCVRRDARKIEVRNEEGIVVDQWPRYGRRGGNVRVVARQRRFEG